MSASSSELDPQFIKALGYLFSKSPDATIKLQKMLDDAIQQSMKKKQDPRTTFDKSVVTMKGVKHLNRANKTATDLKSKKEKDLAQKRQLEKFQKDFEELNQGTAKKARYNTSSPTAFLSSSDVKNKNDSSDATLETKEFTLEMDTEIDACAICKMSSLDKGTPVECQECHNLYHRECHQPPISHQETSDPRCVWYCSWCQKSMKKVAKQINSKSSQAVHSNHVTERVSFIESKPAFVNPFKRHEMKTSIPATSGNGVTGGSLAGWAALSGKSAYTGNSSSKLQNAAKNISQNPHGSSPKHVPSSSPSHSKDKLNKTSKHNKTAPKFAVSDDFHFAKALGADIPSTGNLKSSSKSTSGWGANSKSTVFPKATAVSTGSSKSHSLPGTTAEKRLQSMKKKAKLNTKKSKI